MIDILQYLPKGDKHNSNFFNEYRIKIYERRIASGLADLLGDICAVVVQVQINFIAINRLSSHAC